MASRDQQPGWRRWLVGGRDSWRRVALTGVGAGLALALVGALAMAFIGGGSSALDDSEPTAIAPADGPGGPPVTVPDVLPTEEPILVPTEPIEIPTEPIEVPTEPPVEPTPALPPTEIPLPTDLPIEARSYSRTISPLLPPRLLMRRTFSTRIARSAALHMS